MKLSDEALLAVMDIFRQGITEMTDVSALLRNLDLVEGPNGKLIPRHLTGNRVPPTD